MIYTFYESDLISEPFFVFARRIQIVQFIPLSFNLWGIVQLLIRLKELLIFNGLCINGCQAEETIRIDLLTENVTYSEVRYTEENMTRI